MNRASRVATFHNFFSENTSRLVKAKIIFYVLSTDIWAFYCNLCGIVATVDMYLQQVNIETWELYEV